MKLTKVICTQVVVPVPQGRATSPEYGDAIFDRPPKWIIQAQTDEGIEGLGESVRGVDESVLRAQLRMLAGVDLTGIYFPDPPIYDLSDNDMFGHEHPTRPHRLHLRTFAQHSDRGMHALLLDLLGKHLEVPVCTLFGGAYRTRVRVDTWMARMTPEDSARVCKEAQSRGYQGVKCKCALEDDLVERAEAVRDACGKDFKITFDPNMRFYHFGEAVGTLRQLAQVGNIGCVEDPFPRTDLNSFRLLREQGLFPVALHTPFSDTLFNAIAMGACDYVNLSDTPWNIVNGGALCSLRNIPTWHGAGIELGILDALYLHTCAATRSMSLPSDILGREIREHNLITNPFPVTDGCMQVPMGQGLGVELDLDAMAKYTQKQFVIEL